jgi:predicted dehydrogenase
MIRHSYGQSPHGNRRGPTPFSKEYGAKCAYRNYLELMSDPEIEIIYIGLTHNLY